jgi:AraC-like DNA-binding protein
MLSAPTVPVRSEAKSFKVTDTHLHLPSLALSGCVRAYISRNTFGVSLAPHEMLNHYPASPLCTIMWTINGEGELLSKGAEIVRQKMTEKILISGPHTVPSVTRNIAEVHGVMLFFMPDALQALTGIDVAAMVNDTQPLARVLDASWQRLAQDVLVAVDDVARMECIEHFLRPRWEACREQGQHNTPRLQEWMAGLATRAALSGVGKSTRQIERRVKRWSGLSLQRLRGMARAETSFFEVRKADESEMLRWAEVAFNTGFSDQAHMCRVVRRITGFSPEEIKCAVESEESFWIYRLWI